MKYIKLTLFSNKKKSRVPLLGTIGYSTIAVLIYKLVLRMGSTMNASLSYENGIYENDQNKMNYPSD